MKAVIQLTGLSADRLRVWERRYGAVQPTRSSGEARHYSRAEVKRLQLLQAGVEAGHRISALVALSNEQLRQYAAAKREPEQRDPLIRAICQFDQSELERLLAIQYVGLGLRRFAASVVAPLLREVGERWARGALPIAAEHLASITIRSFLTTALQFGTRRSDHPAILFTTLPDELHEVGTLLAALFTQDMGVRAIYLHSGEN